jgi:hypothetical protein
VLEGQENAKASLHPADATWRVDAKATTVERVVLMVNVVLFINEGVLEESKIAVLR